MRASTSLESAAAAAREVGASPGDGIDYRELVRLGSLAASSHNTQPWRFSSGDRMIRISPDFSRRCPVVDPQDAHLFRSLGCAAENVVHAAAAQGLRADVELDDDAVVVHLVPDQSLGETELSRAIRSRQCTKAPYDGRPLDGADLAALEAAGTGNGVRTIFLTDRDSMVTVTDFVSQGNLAQLSDPAFRAELISWIRSNDRQSLETGDGLSGRTSGQPSIPTWLAKRILPLVLRPKTQIKTDAANIASSSGVAVFVAADDELAAWVEVGRCYERFALQATARGVRTAFINQPIEEPALRLDVERWLGLTDERAQLLVRFGRGPTMPWSMRRPLDDILVAIDPSPEI